MTLNIPNVIAFLVVLFLMLGAYYTKVLTVNEGENKRVKMLKRILVFMVIIGFYSYLQFDSSTKTKHKFNYY